MAKYRLVKTALRYDATDPARDLLQFYFARKDDPSSARTILVAFEENSSPTDVVKALLQMADGIEEWQQSND